MANGKMKIKELFIPVIPLTEELTGKELRIVDHLNLTGSSPRNIGFIPVTELYTSQFNSENAGIGAQQQCLEIKVAALANGEVPSEEEKSLLLSQGIQAYSYALMPLALYYCAEGYTLSAKAYIPSLPKYFSMTGFHSGIKAASKENNLDMAVLFSEKPCSWAGTFTKNAMKAICVEHNIELKSKTVHGLIANSGNANCCTGEEGIKADNDLRKLLEDFLENTVEIEVREQSTQDTVARLASSRLRRTNDRSVLNVHEDHEDDENAEIGVRQPCPKVLSASTGVIGRKLDLSHAKKVFTEKIKEKKNSKSYEAVYDFARAIMTTDTVPKISQDQKQRFLGICKGSGMIAPNMATMLGFIITDVRISGLDNEKVTEFMQETVSEIVNATFNNISVDGDTSTNDMVLLLNNFTGEEINQEEFKSSLEEVCKGLCYQIIADGEGLTKIIDLKLENLPISPLNLQKIGRNIINSMLVKTAIFGNDPNWGRIVAAFAREEALLEGLDMSLIEVNLLDSCVFKNASAQIFGADLDKLAKRLKQARHVEIVISLTKNKSTIESKALNSAHFLGNDLSYDYVKINAEYTS
ncbi:MAG: bifunctional ornithine acetyltransferase/N-acetylglutamate synthase [Cyanobacteria bacterium REEB446]|nr:bifunctional ornithine acetyltransferase/N-acetylglutamate synthase [Cyanobacteria bacterium REEB446]